MRAEINREGKYTTKHKKEEVRQEETFSHQDMFIDILLGPQEMRM